MIEIIFKPTCIDEYCTKWVTDIIVRDRESTVNIVVDSEGTICAGGEASIKVFLEAFNIITWHITNGYKIGKGCVMDINIKKERYIITEPPHVDEYYTVTPFLNE
ncbi:MAG: hypothetical protein DRP00_04885 [Candidatus Aenigmatarchaeota archaeon]|nr:MAG: hypothetical protein DRP00_04885 [Candidatus Aenigmarchaeota archaeon]